MGVGAYEPWPLRNQGLPCVPGFSMAIMRTFVNLRHMLGAHETFSRKLAKIEKKYDEQFRVVFDVRDEIMAPPEPKQIGFHVQAGGVAYRVRRLSKYSPTEGSMPASSRRAGVPARIVARRSAPAAERRSDRRFAPFFTEGCGSGALSPESQLTTARFGPDHTRGRECPSDDPSGPVQSGAQERKRTWGWD